MDAHNFANKVIGGRYKLFQSIGSGGMALIFLAKDLTLERNVAVKILKKDFSSNPIFIDRFLMEAKSAANLSHANIVTVYDFGFDDGMPYLILEYVPGNDLKSILAQKERMRIDEIIPLMIQACAGIGYAHRAGLIHCDVKPHNFIVTADDRLKVTDFGIARALATISPDEHTDTVWGSPLYFSPEQASGQAPSPASDVYSLGVILYESMTGRLPFDSKDPSELARLHREEEPLPPRRIIPDFPADLERVIMKVLSKEPSSRYRTADQLGRVLQTFCEHHNISTPNSPYLQSKKPISTSVISSSGIDLKTLALGFLALISVSGLVPYWLYIILKYSIFNLR